MAHGAAGRDLSRRKPDLPAFLSFPPSSDSCPPVFSSRSRIGTVPSCPLRGLGKCAMASGASGAGSAMSASPRPAGLLPEVGRDRSCSMQAARVPARGIQPFTGCPRSITTVSRPSSAARSAGGAVPMMPAPNDSLHDPPWRVKSDGLVRRGPGRARRGSRVPADGSLPSVALYPVRWRRRAPGRAGVCGAKSVGVPVSSGPARGRNSSGPDSAPCQCASAA